MAPTNVADSTLRTRRRSVAYWAATGPLSLECVAGGVWGGLRLPPFREALAQLGYPAYFMTILGVWYVLAGVALLAPGYARLKEWAYAGLIFNYTGALASHVAVGHGASRLIGPLFFIGLTTASWALRPPARREFPPEAALARAAVRATGGRRRARVVAYWLFTLVVAAEMTAGSTWDLLQIEYVRGVLTHLGYPHYLLSIVGAWKLPFAVAVLVPRFVRLKEWAYAGAAFNFSTAFVSHLLAGDGPGGWGGPLALTAFTMASWALRPPERLLPRAAAATPTRLGAWAAPVVIVAALLVISVLTLPEGSRPLAVRPPRRGAVRAKIRRIRLRERRA